MTTPVYAHVARPFYTQLPFLSYEKVLCGTGGVGGYSNGGAEAYFEYAKALNIVGDYRLSTPINTTRWCSPGPALTGVSSAIDWTDNNISGLNSSETIHGPSCFVIAADLETSDGIEISGLNGEEQNDIALIIQYSSGQDSTCIYDTFVYYDSLLVLRANNVVELIK